MIVRVSAVLSVVLHAVIVDTESTYLHCALFVFAPVMQCISFLRGVERN